MGRGEVPFLAASREQNSHLNSGVLPSVKSQGRGKFLAIRRVVKIHLGVQSSSNYLGGLADTGVTIVIVNSHNNNNSSSNNYNTHNGDNQCLICNHGMVTKLDTQQ